MRMSFAETTPLPEGLRLNALLTLKAENVLVHLVGAWIPTMSTMK